MIPTIDGRSTVKAVPESKAPVEWRPTLRLIRLLCEIFPDSVIDIPEVHNEKEDADDAT